jgi:hypothetical protein
VLGVLLVLVTSAHAACPVARDEAELRAALDAVEAAWSVELAAFERAAADARAILPCVATTIDPATPARVHRAEGLAAFARRDGDSARRAFAAARAADPAGTLPESTAPAGSPLRAEWGAYSPTGQRSPLPAPAEGEVRLDGAPARSRPEDLPVLFQHLDGGGRSDTTAWVSAGAPLPAYPVAARRGAPTAWWVAAGAAAVASGSCLAGAYVANDAYARSETVAEADARRFPVNALAVSSAGLAAVGVGLAAVAVSGSF